MNEPMPGQKTTIVAALFTVFQALVGAGVVPAELAEPGSQAAAGFFALTLALKALRNARKG
jgi:hypothetical protein